jgi:hypothetical protein
MGRYRSQVIRTLPRLCPPLLPPLCTRPPTCPGPWGCAGCSNTPCQMSCPRYSDKTQSLIMFSSRVVQRASGSCHHLLGHRCRGWVPGRQDHTQVDEQARAVRTTCGMGLSSLTPCRLPGQDHRRCHRRLPQLGSTAGDSLPLGCRVQSIGTDDPRARGQHMPEVPHPRSSGHALATRCPSAPSC